MASDVATMATAPDAAPTETTVETGVLPCPHFEGVEKRVEIDFHDGIDARGACQHANHTNPQTPFGSNERRLPDPFEKPYHTDKISRRGRVFTVSRGGPTRADWRIIEPPRRRASAARHPAFNATRLAIPTLTKRRYCLLLPVSLLSQASARCRARFWTTP